MTISLILRIALPFLFALIILPLAVRFVIGRIIYRRIIKNHMAPLEKHFLSGIQDQAAYRVFQIFLKGKINYPFAGRFTVREDLNALLLMVQNAYSTEEREEPQFTFSVSDLIKCAFLLMDEMDSLLRSSRLFRRLGLSRISTLRRFNRAGNNYNRIYEKLPFLKFLRSGRITGKIVRILLIPLIGFPSILISMAASLSSLFLMEIIWRYYYSLLLVKIFSYALMLYGGRKALIREKLEKFSRERIKEEAAHVEWVIDPRNGEEKSPLYEQAFLLYQKTLEDLGISPEKDMNFDGVVFRFNSKRRFFRKLLRIPLGAADKYNPFSEQKSNDRNQLIGLVKSIASQYRKGDRFYDNLRLIDLFDSLYMLSLLGYSRILGGSLILGNLSVDFLLTAKNIGDELFGELVQNRIPLVRKYYRSWRLYRKSRTLFRALRSGNAAGLLFSLTGPLAAEGIKSGIRDYLYRRVGRMALHCYDCNYLGKKRLF